MSRRKRKTQMPQAILYENNTMSKEQMIEIQSEAYYRAFKRIEKDKEKPGEQDTEKKKYKRYEKIFFVLNVLVWPWKIYKGFSVNNQIYDGIPVLFVSFILRICGVSMWLIGLVGVINEICNVFIQRIINNIFSTGVISFVLLVLGSFFILSANEFEKETDSNKIYAYSASIIALVSCIVSIIALVKM